MTVNHDVVGSSPTGGVRLEDISRMSFLLAKDLLSIERDHDIFVMVFWLLPPYNSDNLIQGSSKKEMRTDERF
jgi:hypothetical protein